MKNPLLSISPVIFSLCACSHLMAPDSACKKEYVDGALEFSYNECQWRIEKNTGPDFDAWILKDLNGRGVGGAYFGGAPDIRYMKNHVAPKTENLGGYILNEVLDENGYEALLVLPLDGYGRATYFHVFSPSLHFDEKERLERFVRSVRVIK